MPKENLVASEETKEFYRELPLPNGFNGNEVNGKVYFEAVLSPPKTFVSLATLTESFRRIKKPQLLPLCKTCDFTSKIRLTGRQCRIIGKIAC